MTMRGQAVPWKRTQAVEDRLKNLQIDQEDLDLLDWIPRFRPDPRGYVTRTILDASGGRHAEYLHRVIGERVKGCPLGRTELIDHRDRDPLNNRRRNLRVSTSAQNVMNSPPRNGRRFKGIGQR